MLFQRETRYNIYPMGSGDLATGLSLFSSIVAALLRQRDSGEGAVVESSLYANGIW